MSQRDSFIGGFLAGTIVGGVVGGIIGSLVASRITNDEVPTNDSFSNLEGKGGRKRPIKPPTEQSIEAARRGLEDKIAELNEAIDDVRQQLSSANGVHKETSERAIARD